MALTSPNITLFLEHILHFVFAIFGHPLYLLMFQELNRRICIRGSRKKKTKRQIWSILPSVLFEQSKIRPVGSLSLFCPKQIDKQNRQNELKLLIYTGLIR